MSSLLQAEIYLLLKILETWSYVYKQHFMQKKLNVCTDCKNFYFYYQKGFTEQGVGKVIKFHKISKILIVPFHSKIECNDVILFWRLKRMLSITSNALRQQIVNIEIRRLEREIKDILDDGAQDHNLKKQLLKGKRVELAEELSEFP